MPAIGRQPHLSKTTRLSCSLNCLALESVSQVYFSVKFFSPSCLNFKRYKDKHFFGVMEYSCCLLYLFLIFCFCVWCGNMIWELSSWGLRIDTGKRNRRNVKSHPNKNSHVRQKGRPIYNASKNWDRLIFNYKYQIKAEIFFNSCISRQA